MQGYFLNTRKDKFKDPKVREALTYAFDFESMNRLLFFNQYTRINSYFAGNELQLSGAPTPEETAILETVKDALPAEALTEEFRLPVYDTPQATRDNLRKALQLLAKLAGNCRATSLLMPTAISSRLNFWVKTQRMNASIIRLQQACARSVLTRRSASSIPRNIKPALMTLITT